MIDGPRYYCPDLFQTTREVTELDVLVYGATSGGITAAVEAARRGLRVAIAEIGDRVGGLTASGLGATDFGNKEAIGGLAREFYRETGRHYGVDEAWTFEPKVAEAIFLRWLKDHNVDVYLFKALSAVEKEGARITTAVMEDGHVFRARVFIDATYEGDLLAMAGVSFHVGRESTATYGELYNGVHYGHPNHNFRVAVDPYRVKGDRHSGLLPEIQPSSPEQQGEADHRIQAFNFRFCLTQQSENRVPFAKPQNYDAFRYELLGRYLDEGVFDVFGLSTEMPGGKTDTNNHGAFATDFIGGNYGWPEGSYAQRETIFQDHVDYMSGLFYFLANDSRVPAAIRQESMEYGLCADEFIQTAHWPHQLYIREGRRMVSDVILTEHHCLGQERVPDPVALAAYSMDSHHCQRVVFQGRALNEGNVEIHGFPPYGISYRSIIPRETECNNLLVPWALSASHIAFGSIRMEPVFMALGQSAAIAAQMAIEENMPLQQIPYPDLQRRLQEVGQALAWNSPALV